MAISNLDALISALSTGQIVTYFKSSVNCEGAGLYHSLWRVPGQPGSGSIPTTSSLGGQVYDTDSLGALKYSNISNPSNSHYLARFSGMSTIAGMLILYDRLWSCSGLNLGSTTPHAVSPLPTLPNRPDATGEGVELWFEIYTTGSTGFTAPVFYSASYVNSQNVSGRFATFAIPAGGTTVPAIGQMYKLELDSGDTGVRTVSGLTGSLNSATNANTSGGFVLLRRICEIPLAINNSGLVLDAFQTGLPFIHSGSCLSLAILASTTITGNWIGQLNIIEG